MMTSTTRLRSLNVPGVRAAIVRTLSDATEQILLVRDCTQERGLYPLLTSSGRLGPPLELFEEVESGSILRVHTHSAFLGDGAAFCPSTGLVFFSEGHAILSLSRENICRPVAGSCREAGAQAGFGSAARFTSPSSISVIAPGKLCVADANGLHELLIPRTPEVVGRLSTLAQVRPIQAPLGCDMALTPAAGVGPLVAASRTALYKCKTTDSAPAPLPPTPTAALAPALPAASSCDLSLWVGAEEPPCARAASGTRSSARFLGLGTLTHVSWDSLALLAVDSLHDGTTALRGITNDGSVVTLFHFPAPEDSAGSSGCLLDDDDDDMMDIDSGIGNGAREGSDEYDPEYDSCDDDDTYRYNNANEMAKGGAAGKCQDSGMGAGAGSAAASGLRSLLFLQRTSTVLLCAPMVGQVFLLSMPELLPAGSASRPGAPPAGMDVGGGWSPSPSGQPGTARRELPPRRLSFSCACPESLYCSSALSSPVRSGASSPSYGELQAVPDSTEPSGSGAARSGSTCSATSSGASVAWQGQEEGAGMAACDGMMCEVSSRSSGGAAPSSSFALPDRSDCSGGVWSPVC
ncbi:hypothetical protein HYH03_016414 [Edaphochlamys debaryana]|uniref:Uncharacterized protein n=1 Tax=Edaphochlamys debaryana TaxID=47281 RepID=A0A835XPQ7_9CHLO|nr:hypothetical protein HYH03_016414 [Edaphochlamys debaryana]|eukprot:KAG2484760.1 hypothetical protein HYH03_016414 [Edaphochlamys debaryana]